MTHVVAQPCSDCKYTDCVVVCPVECFYEGEQMLVSRNARSKRFSTKTTYPKSGRRTQL